MPAYEVTDEGATLRTDKEDGPYSLANFAATITHEVRYMDANNRRTQLTLVGTSGGEDLPECTIDATEFPTFNWVMREWGVGCVIYPVGGAKEDLRTAIQMNSRPKKRTVYTHTGWADVGGERRYLHAGGAVGPEGNDPSVSVELPEELMQYDFGWDPKEPRNAKEAILASIRMATMLPPKLGWLLYAIAYSPPIGQCDFAAHIAGRTGTFKSELTSICQSHYGAGMDARHLPASWSSTANANQALAYRAKDAVLVMDDFVPSGTSWNVKALNKNADDLFRSQGNQRGRARLSDTSQLQTTMHPRGIILSTGEDIPEGHSLRSRGMILDLSPGDVTPATLTALQANRKLYPFAMQQWIMYLAAHPQVADDCLKYATYIRGSLQDENLAHARTPDIAGRMIATVEFSLRWAEKMRAITLPEAQDLIEKATMALTDLAKDQRQHLETADPVDSFLEAIRQSIAAGKAHIRTQRGGIPDPHTSELGWQALDSGRGELPNWRPVGACIGWTGVGDKSGELYLDCDASMAMARKLTGPGFSTNTLLKRMVESGKILRRDQTRERNTIRVKAEGRHRTVLCLSLADTLGITMEGDDYGEADTGDSGADDASF